MTQLSAPGEENGANGLDSAPEMIFQVGGPNVDRLPWLQDL
jgi:hypothetical protein